MPLQQPTVRHTIFFTESIYRLPLHGVKTPQTSRGKGRCRGLLELENATASHPRRAASRERAHPEQGICRWQRFFHAHRSLDLRLQQGLSRKIVDDSDGSDKVICVTCLSMHTSLLTRPVEKKIAISLTSALAVGDYCSFRHGWCIYLLIVSDVNRTVLSCLLFENHLNT